jgi:hypothetical protein
VADDYANPPESGDANRVLVAARQIAAGPPKRIVQYWEPVAWNGAALVPVLYPEDSQHASGDYGFMVLAIRKDQPVNLVSADGDYAGLQLGSDGRLWVHDGARFPTGNYRTATGLISGSATAQFLFTIENPVASGRTVFVKGIWVQMAAIAIDTIHKQIKVGRTSAMPTGGTTLSIQEVNNAGPAPVAVCRQSPSASAAAGSMAGVHPGGVITAAGPFLPPLYPILEGEDDFDHIALAQGEALLVHVDANDTDDRYSVFVSWEEV